MANSTEPNLPERIATILKEHYSKTVVIDPTEKDFTKFKNIPYVRYMRGENFKKAILSLKKEMSRREKHLKENNNQPIRPIIIMIVNGLEKKCKDKEVLSTANTLRNKGRIYSIILEDGKNVPPSKVSYYDFMHRIYNMLDV